MWSLTIVQTKDFLVGAGAMSCMGGAKENSINVMRRLPTGNIAHLPNVSQSAVAVKARAAVQ